MSPPVVVMGVSGAGKTTVGEALAARLGVPFVDADDLHPPANRAKMAAGVPLDDADRRPWLELVAAWLGDHPGGGVTACSALRRSYRDVLRRGCPDLRFVLLYAERSLLEERLARRSGHFMPSSLLESQLATLEPLESDESGVVVEVGADLETVVSQAVGLLAAD